MSDKKQIPPSRMADQFVVRFPDGMRDKISEAAKANNRSMNAEILARLEGSFLGMEATPSGIVAMFEAYKAEVDKTSLMQQDRISILANAIIFADSSLEEAIEMLKEFNRPFENTKQDRSYKFAFIERVWRHVHSLLGSVFKFDDITASYHSIEDIEHHKKLTEYEQREEWLNRSFPVFKENEAWPIRGRYRPEEASSGSSVADDSHDDKA